MGYDLLRLTRGAGLRDRTKRRRGTCFRPRIMSPSNRPDFYVVTSHRRSNHVNSPATRPMISHRLSPCFDFGVTDASEVLVWNRKALGGTRCILLEVSALGARDGLSTSHYRGRSPRPSQSPYGDGPPGVPSETWVSGGWRSVDSAQFTVVSDGASRRRVYAARVVEKHHAPVRRSEGFGELAGAGSRSSSAGGGRPGNGGSLVDLLCIFFGTSS